MLAPSPLFALESVPARSRRYGDVLTRLVAEGVAAGMTARGMAEEFRTSTDAVRHRVALLGLRKALSPGVFRAGTALDAEITRRFNDWQQIKDIAIAIDVCPETVRRRIRALALVRPERIRAPSHRPRLRSALATIDAGRRSAELRKVRFGLRSPRRAVEAVSEICPRTAWPVVVPAMFNAGLTLEEIELATGLSPAASASLIRTKALLPCA